MGQRQEELLSIGLKIMFYRKKKVMTQMDLAEKASYSRNHIQQIETWKAVPSVVALLDIAEVLEIPIGNLFEIY